MRDDLEREKIVAEKQVRRTFVQDRDGMIEEMRIAVKRERDEHVHRIVSELDDGQRHALEHQRARMNDELRTEMDEMRRRLQQEHTPALQTFREGALEKRTEALAQEDLRVRAQLDSEMSVLRGRLDAETRKAVEIQRMRMIDEHRRRSEDLTQELLRRHEAELRKER